MLVLTRKPDERIVIDGQIEITVVAISKSRVRIGVSAPPHIPVTRGELEFDFESREQQADMAPIVEALQLSAV